MSRKLLLLPILISGLCFTAISAMAQQVYRSTDAQGNVVFSDRPVEGSETVNIDTPNIADPVDVPPPSSQPEPEPQPEPQVTEEKSGMDIQKEIDAETDYLRRRRYFYSNGDPRSRDR